MRVTVHSNLTGGIDSLRIASVQHNKEMPDASTSPLHGSIKQPCRVSDYLPCYSIVIRSPTSRQVVIRGRRSSIKPGRNAKDANGCTIGLS